MKPVAYQHASIVRRKKKKKEEKKKEVLNITNKITRLCYA